MNYANALKANVPNRINATTVPTIKTTITAVPITNPITNPIAISITTPATTTVTVSSSTITSSTTTVKSVEESKAPEKPKAVVASLHLHSKLHNKAMQPVPKMLLVAKKVYSVIQDIMIEKI